MHCYSRGGHGAEPMSGILRRDQEIEIPGSELAAMFTGRF